MQRRRLLQLGLGAATVLTVAGGGLALLQPGIKGGRLSADGRVLFAAVARAALDGSLPSSEPARGAALARVVDGVERIVAGFPAAMRSELSDLVALLGVAPGRYALAGLAQPWAQADVAAVQRALQRLRTSQLELRQQAYHALRDLVNAAYFADPATWPALDYPGPRRLG